MTKQTGFNPDGNLIVRGSIFGDNDLFITGNANITGTLTVTGTTTLISDTVVQNNADGYAIDYNDNASSSYYQFGSAGARLTWNGANLTVALANGSPIATSFVGDVNFSNNITVTGTIATANSNISAGIANISAGNVSASAFYGSTFSGTSENANYLTTNISLSLSGPISGSTTLPITSGGSFSNTLVTTLGNDSVTLGQHTTGNYVATVADAGNGNTVITGSGSESAAVTIDLGNTPVNPGSYGNATATAGFTVDTKGRLSQANATQIAIPSSQVTDFQTAVRGNVSNSTGLDYNVSTGTFSVSDTAVTATTYNSNVSQVTQFTVNQQGQLTNAVTSAITITSDQVSDFNTAVSNFIADGVYITESNGTIDVSSEVVTTDRDATLANNYTFTGTVNLSGATVTPTANTALLDQNQTFSGQNTFNADVTINSVATFNNNVSITSNNATAIQMPAGQSNTSTFIATTGYVEQAILDLIGDAPAALDTLGEISNALIDDANIGNVLVASIDKLKANTLFKQGNVAMEANLDFAGYYINNLADPVQNQDAVTLAYFDAYTSVIDPTSNVRVYVDTADALLVPKTSTLRSEYFELTATGNSSTATSGTLYIKNFQDGDIVFTPALGTSNIAESRPFIVKGVANAFTSPQQHIDSVLHLRGDVVFDPGHANISEWDTTYGNPGTANFYNTVNFIKNSNATYANSQYVFSNVATGFYKDTIGTSGAMFISGSNITMSTPNSEISTYTVGDSAGTISTSGANTSLSLGVSRAHRQTFGNSTMYIGDVSNISNYTNVIYSGNTFTTGSRPLERLTVDGGVIMGPRTGDDTLLVNGTIFFDDGVFKVVEGGLIKNVTQANIASITFTNGGARIPVGVESLGNYYVSALEQDSLNSISITATGNVSANVITLSANLDLVTETARGNISVTDSGGDGSLGYNSGTGVFTYTGPSQAEANARIDAAPDNVRAHFSGGYGVDITSGVVETANADIRGLFSASGDLAYNASTGVFSFTNDAGDIESVTAGNGLTGGGTSGAVTLNVAGGYGITVNADDIELTNSSVRGLFSGTGLIGYDSGTGAISTTADNYSSWKFTTDTAGNVDITSGSLLSIVGDGNVNVTHSGSTITISSNADINSVVAGSGLTGGGSVGAVTLNIGAGSGITVNADNVAVDSTVVRTTSNQTIAGEKTFSNDADFAADVIIEGNLTVNGTTTTISATTLSVDDNMIYLNANSNTTNIDIGFAGNYNDGTYAHTGFFRDSTDGYWKVFDSYTPEPDAAVDIDTSHASFALADFRADTFRGNLVVPGQYSLPTTDGTASQVLTTDGNGTVSFTNVSAIGLTSVTGGDGLTATPGVGSVDLDVGAGPGITVNADNVAVNVAYVRSQFSEGGDLSYNASTGVFSFTNDAGDIEAVTAGSGLTGGGTSGAVTLNIGSGTGITVNADSIQTNDSQIVHDNLSGFVANEHIDHSTVSITAGAGLTGGGTIAATRTINVAGGYGITVNADNIEVSNTNIRALFSAGGDLAYNASTGVFSFTNDAGDIEGVTAGFGLTGGGTSGTVSLELANASVRSLFSASGDLAYNASTGVFSFTNDAGDIEAVTAGAGLTGGGTSGAVTLNIGAGTGITVNPDNVAVTLSPFSTTNLSEGTNQYYTVARANSAIDARVTTAFVNALNVNATTLDTLDSTAFLRSNADDTHSSNIAPSATNTYSLGTSGAKYANVWATTFQGTATSAQYADLAEKYESDGNYSAGTVVVFGGEKEITTTDVAEDHRVAGIISTDPAFMMNSDSDGQYVALRGRVPCKVIGPVAKGDVLVTSHRPGFAMASSDPKSVPSACIVGKAISSLDSPTEGIVEVVV